MLLMFSYIHTILCIMLISWSIAVLGWKSFFNLFFFLYNKDNIAFISLVKFSYKNFASLSSLSGK